MVHLIVLMSEAEDLNFVFFRQVSDQKPLGSWSVKQGQTVTCPAVCNFQTGEYVVVHDHKVKLKVY